MGERERDERGVEMREREREIEISFIIYLSHFLSH